MLNSTLNDEMSQMFDVLYNNVTSNQAPGLNEYEKSVFLTKAQNQLLVEYFNNRTDGVGGGFDGSQKRQYDFSSLIKIAKLNPIEMDELDKLDWRSLCFNFPSDYFLSVNEIIRDTKYQYTVLPIDYNEYYRLMQKPYAFPVKKAAWRLITGKKEKGVYESSEYYLEVTAGTSIKLTYINVEEKGETDTWTYDTFTDDDFNGERDLPGQGTVDFPALEENPTYANMILPRLSPVGNFRCFTYGLGADKKPYIIECLQDEAGNYSFYLYGLGEEISQKDVVVAEILNKFLSIYWNKTVNIAVKDTQIDHFTKNVSDYDVLPNINSNAGYVFGFSSESTPIVEVIGRFFSEIDYKLRYVKKPAPIILDDLDTEYQGSVSIEGQTAASSCELPEETHQEILERAVTLAKIAWAGGTATQAAAQQQRN